MKGRGDMVNVFDAERELEDENTRLIRQLLEHDTASNR